MKIEHIRKLVDGVLAGKVSLKEILKLDLESRHFDTPILGLISGKIHFPDYKDDESFLSCLSVYRKIEIEKEKNIDTLNVFNISKC